MVQPWYLLWAVIPLAAWATRPVFRVPTIAFSSVVGVILMAQRREYQPFMIVQAAVATTLTCLTVIILTRNCCRGGRSRPPHRSDRAGA